MGRSGKKGVEKQTQLSQASERPPFRPRPRDGEVWEALLLQRVFNCPGFRFHRVFVPVETWLHEFVPTRLGNVTVTCTYVSNTLSTAARLVFHAHTRIRIPVLVFRCASASGTLGGVRGGGCGGPRSPSPPCSGLDAGDVTFF